MFTRCKNTQSQLAAFNHFVGIRDKHFSGPSTRHFTSCYIARMANPYTTQYVRTRGTVADPPQGSDRCSSQLRSPGLLRPGATINDTTILSPLFLEQRQRRGHGYRSYRHKKMLLHHDREPGHQCRMVPRFFLSRPLERAYTGRLYVKGTHTNANAR